MPHTAMEEQPQRADIRGPRTGEGFPTMEKLGTVVEKNPSWNTTVLVVKLDPSSPGMGKNKCFKTSSMKNNIFSFGFVWKNCEAMQPKKKPRVQNKHMDQLMQITSPTNIVGNSCVSWIIFNVLLPFVTFRETEWNLINSKFVRNISWEGIWTLKDTCKHQTSKGMLDV